MLTQKSHHKIIIYRRDAINNRGQVDNWQGSHQLILWIRPFLFLIILDGLNVCLRAQKIKNKKTQYLKR